MVSFAGIIKPPLAPGIAVGALRVSDKPHVIDPNDTSGKTVSGPLFAGRVNVTA